MLESVTYVYRWNQNRARIRHHTFRRHTCPLDYNSCSEGHTLKEMRSQWVQSHNQSNYAEKQLLLVAVVNSFLRWLPSYLHPVVGCIWNLAASLLYIVLLPSKDDTLPVNAWHYINYTLLWRKMNLSIYKIKATAIYLCRRVDNIIWLI